VIQHTVI